MANYESYRTNVNFINKYRRALNAASGSEVDANANVENKNVATMAGEMPKRMFIGTNRLMMHDKIEELFGKELADEYIRQLDSHEIYKHDETSIFPYCVSITMYPFLFNGLSDIGGVSKAPTNLQAFCGSFINLVFAVAAQFAGAVATPEFLTYMDYFIRLEFGDDYYTRPDEIVYMTKNPGRSLKANGASGRTIDKIVTDYFEQVIYSMNQPAAARNSQSVFWNIAYFDKPYFDGIFEGFVFPDGTTPKWESVSWLQKRFMQWFNKERTRSLLTFPVETLNLLNDGVDFVDKEWAEFATKMYADGHSFFTYTSDSVDSLASCCFDGKQKCLTRSSDGINYMTFEELYAAPYNETKRNFKIFHNGSWVGGKLIRLPKRQMYKIVTSNKKELFVTDNHLFPTINGDKEVKDLTTEDYLLFNCRRLDAIPEKDNGLTYDQGFLIGMYLGDGSTYQHTNCNATPQISLSLNENKYVSCKKRIESAVNKIDESVSVFLNTPYNNVYPVAIRSWAVYNFIKEYVSGKYSFEKQLNLSCLEQSYDFRMGILDGFYATDGGNSNRIYTTSQVLVEQIECLITSLGLSSVIDVSDRTDEKCIIRGIEYNHNYPLYCIRWYSSTNKRTFGNDYRVVNNSEYRRITSIEPYDTDSEFVYCFEMSDENEPYFTLPNGVISHNCRLRNGITDNTFSYTLGAGGISTGSKSVMTININRLVQNVYRNKENATLTDVSEAVREQVKKIHKYQIAFNEIMKANYEAGLLPVYNAGFISLEKQYLTIGINGGVEAAEFLGIDISPNEKYYEFMEAILKPIYEENKAAKTKELMFNTEFVPKMCGDMAA